MSSQISRYIAKGTYGCVIKPSIDCKDTSKTLEKTVTKLFSDRKTRDDEIKENEIIKEIDPNNDFTIQMISNCEISSQDIKAKVQGIDNCNNINNDSIYEIIYQDGGDDLRKLFKEELITIKYPNFSIKDFLEKFKYIFQGLLKLQEKNLWIFIYVVI